MKKLFNILFATLAVLSIYSCKEDDSLAISQDQLLRANKWQLKEIRTTTGNITSTDKLLECERQSTMDFTDLTKYFSVAYKTESGSCKQTQSDGTYTFVTGKSRLLKLVKSSGEKKDYYMFQLDPYFMILQDTLKNSGDTIQLRLQVFEPTK
jgi:hypothetical protein